MACTDWFSVLVILSLWLCLWSPASTRPSLGCDTPVLEEAVYTGGLHSQYPGGKLKFMCKENYYKAATYVTCLSNLTWSNPTPPCKLVICPNPSGPENGFHHVTTLMYEGILSLWCSEGYKYTGTERRQCQRDGTWSGTDGNCTEIECPPLTAPDNGRLSSADSTYQSEISVICAHGYVYTGTTTRRCQADRTWSGHNGTCKEIWCPPLQTVDNGYLSSRVTRYMDHVDLTCQPGYYVDGATNVTCQADGTYSQQLGTCEKTGLSPFMWLLILPVLAVIALLVVIVWYFKKHEAGRTKPTSSTELDLQKGLLSDPPQSANPQESLELQERPIAHPAGSPARVTSPQENMYQVPHQHQTHIHQHHHYQQLPSKKTQITVGFKLTDVNGDVKSIEKDLKSKLFGNKITNAITASFGESAPEMTVKYTNPMKRFVSVEINDNGVGQDELTEALHGSKVQSRVEAGKEYTIVRDSVVFMDMVGAAIASEIYNQKHVPDQTVDKKIDLEKNYVRLRLLNVKNMAGVQSDDFETSDGEESDEESDEEFDEEPERPDYYQLYLEKCGGTDIQEEDLVKDEDIGKCTLLRGRAGIGKSTTVQQLFWKWAHGEWGKQFKAMFLLNIRHFLHVQSEVDFWNLLSLHSVYATGNVDQAWLKDNEEHLCIFLDGIDEVWKFKDKYHEKGLNDDVKSPRTALDWCFCLLQRKRLSSATLIVSSRPFADLSVVKPSKLVELMGLTRELVMNFVDYNVTPKRAEYVKKTLRDNPILLSVSAVTYYCAALCRVLEATNLGTKDFKTYTQINSYIIEDYMKRCLKASEGLPVDINPSLRAISRLAYSGLVRTGPNDLTRLVFSRREYEDLGISDADINLMTRAGIFSILEEKKNQGGLDVGQFAHLSIQEFLAMAGYLLQDNSDTGKAISVSVSEDDSYGGDAISDTSTDDSDGRDAISQMFESGQFVMAQLYLFGLVFNHQHTSVEAVMARLGLNEDKMTLKQEALRENLMTSDDELIAMQCINEGQCEQTAQLYAEQCLGPNVEYDNTPLTAIDMNALEFTLTHHLTSLNELSLNFVNIDVTSVQTVLHIVNKCQTLTTLRLVDKTIDDDCLHVLSQQWQNSTLQQLTLGHGPIGDTGVASIKDVQRKATGLKALQLIYYNVTDLGVQQYLPVVVHNPLLRYLRIDSDSVTNVGLQHVAHMVSTNTHLEDVRLYISSIQEEGVDAIMDAMDKNQTITMWLFLQEECDPHLEQRLRTCNGLSVYVQ